MLSKHVNIEEAALLLNISEHGDLESAVEQGLLTPVNSSGKVKRFLVGDIVKFRLSQVLQHSGIDSRKSVRYAAAILDTRLSAHDKNVVEWVENETQELFCLIADDELARIFLRSREDSKELDVGAVKPVLFPTTKCEINVFRVIRPVILRAGRLTAKK